MSDTILRREATFDNYATEKVDVSKNSLLGDYNSKGDYVISRNIMKELVLLKKTRVGAHANSVFCVTRLRNFGVLNFEVKFLKDDAQKKAIAELYILEKVSKVNGLYENTIRTKVGKYTSEISEKFASVSMDMYNISVNDDDDKGQERFESEESDAKYIIARIKFTQELDKLTGKEYASAYEKYYNQRIELLKSLTGSYGQEVLSEFSKEYNSIDNFFKINKHPDKYKHLNELLDKTIEAISAKQDRDKAGEDAFKKGSSQIIEKFSSEVDEKKANADNNLKNTSKHYDESAIKSNSNDHMEVRDALNSKGKDESRTSKWDSIVYVASRNQDMQVQTQVLVDQPQPQQTQTKGEVVATTPPVNETTVTVFAGEVNEVREKINTVNALYEALKREVIEKQEEVPAAASVLNGVNNLPSTADPITNKKEREEIQKIQDRNK